MKFWVALLAIFLLAHGAAGVFNLSFNGMPLLMGVVAIVDGILIFLDK